ncbi:large subunit GTPase 1-like protein, partial [Leptotrombidium deliense]
RENIKLVDPRKTGASSSDLLGTTEVKPVLCVPRRPIWDKDTSPELLAEREYQSFLDWRRELAILEEKENAVLTPFERNIEFWRQLWRVLERSDVLVQIVDARNPLLFYCEDLVRYVSELSSKKRCIILLNKSDFLNDEQREHWLHYFTRLNITVAFFSAIQEPQHNEEHHTQNEEVDSSEESDSDENNSKMNRDLKTESNKDISTALNEVSLTVNAPKVLRNNELIAFFKSLKCENENRLTVGFVGYPNVGKSSTINAILQSKKVSVSATPGKTKHFQTIEIDEELCLCDCPGLVFPKMLSSKAEMIINGILPVDQMTDCRPPIALIVSLIPKHIFETTYSILIPENETEKPLNAEQLLNVYGLMRGFMTQRGLPDNARAARYIIKDFLNGRLLYCFAPPNVDQKIFHTFPPKPENLDKCYENISSKQKKLMKLTSDVSEAEFDANFFKNRNAGIHAKGVQKYGVYYNQLNSTTGEPCLPPKKHFNRKKKEKLRKVYGYLDVK